MNIKKILISILFIMVCSMPIGVNAESGESGTCAYQNNSGETYVVEIKTENSNKSVKLYKNKVSGNAIYNFVSSDSFNLFNVNGDQIECAKYLSIKTVMGSDIISASNDTVSDYKMANSKVTTPSASNNNGANGSNGSTENGANNANGSTGNVINNNGTNGSTNSGNTNNQYVYNESDWNLCTNPKALSVFKFIGNILKVAFIAVPIVLIIMGSIDFMKAVLAGKEDEIKKNQSVFVKRIIAAVLVFFIPVIVKILMNTVLNQTETNCLTCVLNPDTCITN